MFIELTNTNQRKVFVNPYRIDAMVELPDNPTSLVMQATELYVRETPEEIIDKIEEMEEYQRQQDKLLFGDDQWDDEWDDDKDEEWRV